MRKVAAAALAVPILALLYIPLLARRSVAARVALLASVGVLVTVAALGLSRPVEVTATAPGTPISALPDEAFRTIRTATELRAPVAITFSEPMNPRSVATAVSVSPATATSLSWNAELTVLTVRPAIAWTPGTYHTISVEPGAMAETGRPMAQTIHAAFITRPATGGRLTATRSADGTASVATAFRITFDRAVATTAVEAALRTSPAIVGSLTADAEPGSAEPETATSFTFTPAGRLAPGTLYRLSLGALLDADGAPVGAVEGLSLRTSAAPTIVRFRPLDGTTRVDRRAALSVRFSEPMSHATTRAAFSVTASGKAVRGTFRFAENSTVLVFQPASALPAGSKVVVRVAPSATSAAGVPLARAGQVTITTVPEAPAAPAKAPAPASTSSGSSGGGAVGGGSWGAVETYYLRLMNCTRTGGLVTSSGGCSSPGGRNVAALKLDAGISSKVSRPYAKKLAVNNLCTHFSGGNPGDRLRAAGYTSYIWAENLGCRSGNPYDAVLGSHLFFQSERSYNGGHYVNLMNADYDRVGIGVWVSGGRVRLVVDFYRPR